MKGGKQICEDITKQVEEDVVRIWFGEEDVIFVWIT